ncbi:hypothetical protein IJ596_05735 [bacterium]|nr:hypothetical protein [bacterium]
MKKLFLIFLLLITPMLICSAEESDGINWKHVAPNNYIDPDGITGTTDRYGYSFLLKSYNKGQYEPIEGRQVLYTLGQYEIDCLKRKYRLGTIDSYDDDGIFLNGDYNKYAQFQPIVSGTAVSAVSRKLCKP